jgi:hypothetical protein
MSQAPSLYVLEYVRSKCYTQLNVALECFSSAGSAGIFLLHKVIVTFVFFVYFLPRLHFPHIIIIIIIIVVINPPLSV